METTIRENNAYRWFRLWIFVGAALALLLLVNSVSNYLVISRRISVDMLRRDLATHAVGLDQSIRAASIQGPANLRALLDAVRSNSGGKIAWLVVRDSSGKLLAASGALAAPTFDPVVFREQSRKRLPVYKTLETESGEVVVEAFPLRLPAFTAPVVFRNISVGDPPAPRPWAMLEIARFLDGTSAPLWSLRRSLIINSSAALALLVSLALMARRFRAYVAGQRLEQQLAIARQVQEDLLPANRPAARSFDLAAHNAPAAQVGGDFYDTFPTDNLGHAFVLGDVSGKGIPAALLMGVLHGAVRSSSWTESPQQHVEATRRLNRLLCEHASHERFATMFWAYYDAPSGLLHYVNAGHCPPLLLRDGATRVSTLDEGGPVLGLLPGAGYRQGSVALEPGDTLVLYSDGIIETAAPDGDLFGAERLADVLENASGLDAAAIRDRILDHLAAFAPVAEPDDDRTLLVVRHTGAAASALVPCAA
jgi:hypothetical protein